MHLARQSRTERLTGKVYRAHFTTEKNLGTETFKLFAQRQTMDN